MPVKKSSASSRQNKLKKKTGLPALIQRLGRNKRATFIVAFALVGVVSLLIVRAYSRTAEDWNMYAPGLRQCESGGDYSINTGNGYYGAYQFDRSTWQGYDGYNVHGYETANLAPKQIQDLSAYQLFLDRGMQPWGCASYALANPYYGPEDSTGGSAPAPPSGGNPSSDDACHGQVLRRGSGGGCVSHLQEHLNSHGHGLSTDGDFGPATESAVRSFQSSRGLGADGIVGGTTWNALHGGAPAPNTPAPGGSDRIPSGTIDSLSCNEISGWAYDPDKSDASIEVHIYMDSPGANGTAITANVSRPDVNNAFGITGSHGFQWAVPQQWRDGQTHQAYLYAIGLDSAGNKNGANPQITAYSFNSSGSFGPCQAPAAPAPTTAAPAPNTPAPAPAAAAPARANGGGLITAVQNSQLCLDVPNVSTTDGTRVALYACNSGANQQWIYNAATGTIRVYDNKCLDVLGFNTANHADVGIYECHGAANQQWRQYGANSIQSVHGGKCLDLPGNSTRLGTLLQMYDCNNTSAQQWNGGPVRSVPLAPAPTPVAPAPTPTPTPAPVAPAPSGAVAITGVASGRCTDIPGSSRTPGMYTQLYDCNGTEAQAWTFTGSSIKIYAGTPSEMCLDVNNGSLNNGAAVIVWPCHYGPNQQWSRPGDGTIRSAASGKCLDAYAGGTANETRLIMYTCHTGGNQKWRFGLVSRHIRVDLS